METGALITKTIFPNIIAGHSGSTCAARLLWLFFLALPAVVQGQAFTNSDGIWDYTTNADGLTLTITEYTGASADVTIPTEIDGLVVNAIGQGAFSDSLLPSSLTSITIGTNITSIGDDAFAYCSGLTSVTIPGSVTNLGDYAFAWCSSLSLVIVSSLTNVFFTGNAPTATLTVFSGESVTVYYLPGTTGWGATFAGGPTVRLSLSPTIVVPPQSQTVLAGSAVELEVVAGGVPPLVYQWFSDGQALADATNFFLKFDDVPGSQSGAYTVVVTNSYGSVTSRVATLTVQIERTYTNSYGTWTYTTNADGLTLAIIGYSGSGGEVTIPTDINGLAVNAIGQDAFFYCWGLTSVTIGTNVTSIGGFAFAECYGLTSMTIPGSVTNVGAWAFAWCNSLASVFFTGNAPTAASYVFWGESVTVYYFPGTIGWGSTFVGAPTVMLSLSPAIVTPPQSQTVLAGSTVELEVVARGALPLVYQWFFNGNAMSGAMNFLLKFDDVSGSQSGAYTVVVTNAYGSATSPAAILTVQNEFTYTNNYGIWTYTINPDGRTLTIIEYTGSGGDVTIPADINGLTVNTIGQDAFFESGMTSVSIPNSVTSIGYYAFAECYGLTSVTIPGSVTNLGAYAFAFCTNPNLAVVSSLTNVFFTGNAPVAASTVFWGSGQGGLTVYYLPGTTGWGSTFAGGPTVRLSLSPTIVVPPESQTVLAGSAVKLEAVAGGAPPLVYQWFFEGQALADATNFFLKFDDVPGSQSGAYTVVVTNSYGSVTSLEANLNVQIECLYTNNYGTWTYTTNVDGQALTIIGYTGSGGEVTIPSDINGLTVNGIGQSVFFDSDVTGVTVGTNITSIGVYAFAECSRLTSMTIPGSVTNIGAWAFAWCGNLTNLSFAGNAPTTASYAFWADSLTVYCLPGATGWDTSLAGMTVVMVPGILWPPQTQTAEIGSTVDFTPGADGIPAVTCEWFFNGANLINRGTNVCLELTNVDYSRDGAYTLVVMNAYGAVTSPPAMLDVIPVVPRRLVPAVQLTGAAGSRLNVDYVNSLKPALNDWTTLDSVSLTSTSQFYFDLSEPLPPKRFYRAWQSGTPAVAPSLNLPGLVPAITLAGTVGHSLELDYINQLGPTNAWVTLGTITLTNTSQLYFDVSVLGQPARLYRIVPVP